MSYKQYKVFVFACCSLTRNVWQNSRGTAIDSGALSAADRGGQGATREDSLCQHSFKLNVSHASIPLYAANDVA